MKILSYSFFEPKVLPQHRFWDKNKSEQNRYYFNIPAVVLTNKLLMPDYVTRIYLTRNVMYNDLAMVFKILKDVLANSLEFVVVDMNYELTEPSLLRMAPLWQEIEVFHTRDIDSIQTKIEFQFIREFEKSPCTVGSIRSHENHYGGCRMLAGLSSFKPTKIPERVKGKSFQEYFDKSHGNYGCDQDLMVDMFTSDTSFTWDNYMDCRAYNQKRPPDFPCVQVTPEDFKEPPALRSVILDKIAEYGFENWSGEPVDARGGYTSFVLDHFQEVRDLINKYPLLRDFYKV
jgi:hypothetical protein